MRPRSPFAAEKKRKQPYYFGALAAWVALIACICLYLYYVQQTADGAEHGDQNLRRQNTQSLQDASSPKVNRRAGQAAGQISKRRSKAAGQSRHRAGCLVANVIAAINRQDSADGVWITELWFPMVSNAGLAGSRGSIPPARKSRRAGGEIDGLIINGLYHANVKTEVVDS